MPIEIVISSLEIKSVLIITYMSDMGRDLMLLLGYIGFKGQMLFFRLKKKNWTNEQTLEIVSYSHFKGFHRSVSSNKRRSLF